MSYIPTQKDINLLFQSEKSIYSKIELLDNQLHVLNSIEGNLISDSFFVDSTSNIRRTYQMELRVSSSSFLIGKNTYVWFDKLIRPYVGIYSVRERKIMWYLMGTYLYTEGSFSYDETANTLSISCGDIMNLFTGDRDGAMDGLSTVIYAGDDIKNAIIGILDIFGITKYRIDAMSRTLPYDLEFSGDSTACSMIERLMEFLPNYEFFFDLDGTFVVQKLPCYVNEADFLNYEIFKDLVKSENYSFNFRGKNCVKVWGRTYAVDSLSRYSENCTYSNNTYTVLFDQLEKLDDYMTIGIKIPADNLASCQINLNHLKTCVVLDDYERELTAKTLTADTPFIFRYLNSKLYFCGQFQIEAAFKNENNASPLSIDNVGKEIWDYKSGGEYEDINSDLLAKEKAMYECYYAANLNEALTLQTCPIPFLDVNTKISYAMHNKYSGEGIQRWIITSISGGTMADTYSVTLNKYYPEWSEVYQSNFA